MMRLPSLKSLNLMMVCTCISKQSSDGPSVVIILLPAFSSLNLISSQLFSF